MKVLKDLVIFLFTATLAVNAFADPVAAVTKPAKKITKAKSISTPAAKSITRTAAHHVKPEAQTVTTENIAETVIPEGAQFLVGDEKGEFYVVGKGETAPKIETKEEKVALAVKASAEAEAGLNETSDLIKKTNASKLAKVMGEKIHPASPQKQATVIPVALRQAPAAMEAENKVKQPLLQIAEYPSPPITDTPPSAGTTQEQPAPAQQPTENTPAANSTTAQPAQQPTENVPTPSSPPEQSAQQPTENTPAASSTEEQQSATQPAASSTEDQTATMKSVVKKTKGKKKTMVAGKPKAKVNSKEKHRRAAAMKHHHQKATPSHPHMTKHQSAKKTVAKTNMHKKPVHKTKTSNPRLKLTNSGKKIKYHHSVFEVKQVEVGK